MGSSKRVLLVAPEDVEVGALVKALGRVGARVEVLGYAGAGSTEGVEVPEGGFEVAVVACRQVHGEGEEGGEALRGTLEQVRPLMERVQSQSPCPVVLVSDHHNSHDMLDVLRLGYVTHLIPWSDAQARRQIVVAVHKLLTRDPWGMERYFREKLEIHNTLVRSSAQRDVLLGELAEALGRLKVNRRLVALAQSVADEFIINAVYNAPVDEDGERLYASRSRTEPVELTDAQAALFRYACDGERLYLSIFDPFGSLPPETVRRYLIRCLERGEDQIEHKAGGAGLGIYTILESVNRLIINIVPGGGTEMIGILEVHRSYKRFLTLPKSLHLYVGGESDAEIPITLASATDLPQVR